MTQAVDGAKRVQEDAALLLRTVRDETAAGRRPWRADISRLVATALAVEFGELVRFLERYGYLATERKADLLEVTHAGRQVADGASERARALEADARHHFGDRLTTAATAAPQRGLPTRFDGRWLRESPIGAGALGAVWRGRLLSTDRPVAIKVMSGLNELFSGEQRDEVLRRLELAVRAQATLSSPFVVQVVDQNASYETPYFVMELATGGSLRALLEGGPLPPAVAVRFFLQIALGLRAAHAAGLVHRDLKPENVLLDASGNVKLTDFGLTRVVERDGVKLKQAYVGFGSVGYMAPECFRRGADAGPTADLYALGILLYELLVGELPGRRSPMPSQVVPGVPADLDDLFDALTQDDAAKRPVSIDAVLTRVWTSPQLVALLDARQAPFFSDPPVALPGLPTPQLEPVPAAAAASSESPAGQRGNEVAVAPEPAPSPQAEVLNEPAPTAELTMPAEWVAARAALVDATSLVVAASAPAPSAPEASPEAPSHPGAGLIRPRPVQALSAPPRPGAVPREADVDRSIGPDLPADSVWLGASGPPPHRHVPVRIDTQGLNEADDDAFLHEATAERRSVRLEREAGVASAETPFDDSVEASDDDVLVDDSSVDEALSSVDLRVETAVVDLRRTNDARATTSEPARLGDDDD